jgi:hypothetical protein
VLPPKSKPKKANDKLLVERETETTNKRAIEAKTIVFLNGFLYINVTITLCYIEIVLLKTAFILLVFCLVI